MNYFVFANKLWGFIIYYRTLFNVVLTHCLRISRGYSRLGMRLVVNYPLSDSNVDAGDSQACLYLLPDSIQCGFNPIASRGYSRLGMRFGY